MDKGSVTVETDNDDLVVVEDKEFDAQNSVHVHSIHVPSNLSHYSTMKKDNSRTNSPMIKIHNQIESREKRRKHKYLKKKQLEDGRIQLKESEAEQEES